ncbi:uncharacterized protein KY384_003904 [Bacidia gigantensis]|uniref:uncharacterized protein n=1 Tax=Bacidia gigantensis TaxID=2732470 RepID=UPI001D0455A9|nr:uncharacterized protein KY384_003904 [Bacidia gigantensis]KAG8532263.1 hypothetical protein KY384_003904 [Bacidia gigantensis]
MFLSLIQLLLHVVHFAVSSSFQKQVSNIKDTPEAPEDAVEQLEGHVKLPEYPAALETLETPVEEAQDTLTKQDSHPKDIASSFDEAAENIAPSEVVLTSTSKLDQSNVVVVDSDGEVEVLKTRYLVIGIDNTSSLNLAQQPHPSGGYLSVNEELSFAPATTKKSPFLDHVNEHLEHTVDPTAENTQTADEFSSHSASFSGATDKDVGRDVKISHAYKAEAVEAADQETAEATHIIHVKESADRSDPEEAINMSRNLPPKSDSVIHAVEASEAAPVCPYEVPSVSVAAELNRAELDQLLVDIEMASYAEKYDCPEKVIESGKQLADAGQKLSEHTGDCENISSPKISDYGAVNTKLQDDNAEPLGQLAPNNEEERTSLYNSESEQSGETSSTSTIQRQENITEQGLSSQESGDCINTPSSSPSLANVYDTTTVTPPKMQVFGGISSSSSPQDTSKPIDWSALDWAMSGFPRLPSTNASPISLSSHAKSPSAAPRFEFTPSKIERAQEISICDGAQQDGKASKSTSRRNQERKKAKARRVAAEAEERVKATEAGQASKQIAEEELSAFPPPPESDTNSATSGQLKDATEQRRTASSTTPEADLRVRSEKETGVDKPDAPKKKGPKVLTISMDQVHSEREKPRLPVDVSRSKIASQSRSNVKQETLEQTKQAEFSSRGTLAVEISKRPAVSAPKVAVERVLKAVPSLSQMESNLRHRSGTQVSLQKLQSAPVKGGGPWAQIVRPRTGAPYQPITQTRAPIAQKKELEQADVKAMQSIALIGDDKKIREQIREDGAFDIVSYAKPKKGLKAEKNIKSRTPPSCSFDESERRRYKGSNTYKAGRMLG